MKTKYERARTTAYAMNRFLKRTSRPRRDERKAHFEQDRRYIRELLADPNVLGFGVGPKIVCEERVPEEFCLVFFVRKKLPKSRLRRLIAVPKHMFLTTTGVKVFTDVQEWRGLPVAHSGVSAGDSVGDVSGNSGTMTLAVADNATGEPLILSCSHVLALCGQGNVGDEVDSPANPASALGPNTVGRLLRFTKIDPSSTSNAVDAAVAGLLPGVTLSNNITGIGKPTGIRDLTLEGDAIVNTVDVQTRGIATGQRTQGTVRNLHVTAPITFHQLPGDPSAYFVDLVQYDAPSLDGDSGAAVVDTTVPPNVVGMLIAGLPDGSASFFTHIRYVFARLQVRFWSGP